MPLQLCSQLQQDLPWFTCLESGLREMIFSCFLVIFLLNRFPSRILISIPLSLTVSLSSCFLLFFWSSLFFYFSYFSSSHTNNGTEFPFYRVLWWLLPMGVYVYMPLLIDTSPAVGDSHWVDSLPHLTTWCHSFVLCMLLQIKIFSTLKKIYIILKCKTCIFTLSLEISTLPLKTGDLKKQ